jgi:triose/dihydroxyacetone kinase / FAD-AMP lyase (cyclizing)
VRPTCNAAEMAEMMLEIVLPDLPFKGGDRVAVLVSGLGATPLMEQYILYGEVAKGLLARGITVAFRQIGNLFTSLEMMGVTLTVMQLDDDLEAGLRHPCRSVGLALAGEAVAPRAYTGTLTAVSTAASASAHGSAAAARTFSGPTVALDTAGGLVRDLIATIVEHRQMLSDIDGLIGDGDHGVNMAKGFTGCGARLDALGERAQALPAALEQLSQALMDDIGGSMGPLYGNFFLGFVQELAPHAHMDAALFGDALAAAIAKVQAMGHAQVGDKTLIDTLVPARDAYRQAVAAGAGFAAALEAMSTAAEAGKDSTKALQARIGRSARLGPRSIGVLDAGATSCWLILRSMAESLRQALRA